MHKVHEIKINGEIMSAHPSAYFFSEAIEFILIELV
jgi:hypothetical protein